jgi:hypothetical protein
MRPSDVRAYCPKNVFFGQLPGNSSSAFHRDALAAALVHKSICELFGEGGKIERATCPIEPTQRSVISSQGALPSEQLGRVRPSLARARQFDRVGDTGSDRGLTTTPDGEARPAAFLFERSH